MVLRFRKTVCLRLPEVGILFSLKAGNAGAGKLSLDQNFITSRHNRSNKLINSVTIILIAKILSASLSLSFPSKTLMYFHRATTTHCTT